MLPSEARQSPRAFWAGLLLLSLFHLPVSSAHIASAQEGRRDSIESARLSPELERFAQAEAAS
ncbi:MAG TPA: hypothetical protein VJZ26_18915, partial [Blastocatellia bacterium]|nr:hypothetical protein [Blastocatellia bacterium]